EKNVNADQGLTDRRDGTPPRKTKVVGVYGYYAGPAIHVVDVMALCDPFLARLPALTTKWRIGHFERDVSEEYLKTLREGTNALTDPRQHRLYDDVREMTQGPIWRLHRFETIARLAARF